LLVSDAHLHSGKVIVGFNAERRIKYILVVIHVANLTFVGLDPLNHFLQYPVNFVLALSTLAEAWLSNF